MNEWMKIYIAHKKNFHTKPCVFTVPDTHSAYIEKPLYVRFSPVCTVDCTASQNCWKVLCCVLYCFHGLFFSHLQVCFVYTYVNRPENFTMCDKRDSQPDVFISCFTQLGFQTWSCPSDAVVVSHLTGKPNWMSGHARENKKLCSWTGVLNCAPPCKRHIAGNWKKCCSIPGCLHCKRSTG